MRRLALIGESALPLAYRRVASCERVGRAVCRWRIPPASMAIHLCIGSVYAWSMFNLPLTRELGVVASSSADWCGGVAVGGLTVLALADRLWTRLPRRCRSLGSVVPIFSTAIVCLGLSAAVAGKWLEEVGPRAVGLLSAAFWGGGFVVGGLGIMTHTLPLVYLGYGVLGG